MGMMNMRIRFTSVLGILSLVLLSSCGAGSQEASSGTSRLSDDGIRRGYPIGPDDEKTPGKTCEHADEYRYAERIAYCNRNVHSETKAAIIQEYDRDLGFAIGKMPRSEFKIDHYIPLCMGGSNSEDNLWPQHKKVYEITDPLEGKLCQLMANGSMRQAKAISLIREAKNDLSRAPLIDRDLDRQL